VARAKQLLGSEKFDAVLVDIMLEAGLGHSPAFGGLDLIRKLDGTPIPGRQL